MKTRKFYPRQVLRRLQGGHAALSAGQRAALAFACRRGRKLGYAVSVATQAAFDSPAVAAAILANATWRINLSPAV